MGKELHGNYTRMLQVILNKSRRQHPTKQQPYGHLPPITKTIQVRWTRHAGHCWRSREEFISDILLWTPSHGWAKAGQPARTYIQQFCADTGCSLEELLEEMDNWEGWQERVRDICADGATWWWWWKEYSDKEKLGLTTLLERRIWGDMIETFKIINGIFNYIRHFFNISPQTGNLLSRHFKNSLLTNWIFFANRVIYFLNKLPNMIKNSQSVKIFKIKLDGNPPPQKKNPLRQKNLREYFWKLSLNRTWSIYRYINIVYVLYKYSLFWGWCEKIIKSEDVQGGIINKILQIRLISNSPS